MSEFFSMGGYAFYVWTSYGITSLVLLWTLFSPMMQHRARLRQISADVRRSHVRAQGGLS